MIAKPKRGSMVGEKKRYDITATAIAEGGITQTVNCELHHNPFIGSLRPILRAVGTVIILAAVGIGAYSLLQLGGGWGMLRSSPQAWVNQLVYSIQSWFFR